MKPAFSVLIFTVCSGAGYGLLMWLVALQIYANKPINITELLIGGLAGLALITVGLLSSTLHLANPKNAWRAFNRFRTSWLSREGVFAVLYYPLILSYGLVIWLNGGQLNSFATALGFASIIVALLTVISTGMIYASLKPIRQWHNPFTTPIYVLFSLMSGSLLTLSLQNSLLGQSQESVLIGLCALIVISGVVKLAYFVSIGKPEGLTINRVTGFSEAHVRLMDAGHNADTFLTKEFIFKADAIKLMCYRKLVFVLALLLPLIIVGMAYVTTAGAITYLALIPMFVGLLLERWLFFAEARHVVRLYHGDQHT